MKHSLGGVVETKLGNDLTILLTTGVSLQLRVKHTSLVLGQRVHIVFNHETGKVKEVLAVGASYPDPTASELLPWENTPDPEDTKLGDWELEFFSGTGE
jgi:hypothetical protein